MPGFNQRGPMNDGPMTGQRKGICTNPTRSGQAFSGMGKANCQRIRGGQGRRGNQGGYCRQMNFNEEFNRKPTRQASSKESLKDRAAFLEAELKAIKKEFSDIAEP